MSEKVKQAVDYCTKNGQGHLARYLKPVFSEHADQLAREIIGLDFKQVDEMFSSISAGLSGSGAAQSEELTPLRSTVLSELSEAGRSSLIDIGCAFIASGRLGAVTMAGGQGTRLGHTGPKGTFVLPSDPPRSLFQGQCDGLRRIGAENGVVIPWFIMTSVENHDATVRYFEDNAYFGYDPSRIEFFPQDMVPVVDFEGHLMVKDNHIIKGSNGNGGVFSSLWSSGILDRLGEIGVERMFICGVDNALIRMADPVFIGFAVQSGKPIASKSVYKRSYDEKAGVFCKRNNRPYYVEYTEISEEQARSKDSDGRFLFGDAGIVTYVYDTALLKHLAVAPLPYHAAYKKVAFDNPGGGTVVPTAPNAIKFETFIFDSFEAAEDIAVLRVDRNEEFAPIKNSSGEDSPEAFLRQIGGQTDES
ncbi:MAG: UTP--glucose-1-phosphate uridylyltransferase [Saccharofermentanales bacterium]